jgi:hypothetical protein
MSPTNFNLFTWIREGVKQSVVLGVSDAIETIGVPDNSEDISPRLLAFLRRDGESETEKRSATGTSRKRLGRTLKDLEAEAGTGAAAEG